MPPEVFGYHPPSTPHQAASATNTHAKAGPTLTVEDFATRYDIPESTIEKLKSQGMITTAGWEFINFSDLEKTVGLKYGELLAFRKGYEDWAKS